MFRKLKFRLVAVNVTVVSVLFFLIIVGIYFTMNEVISLQSTQLMQIIATSVETGPPNRNIRQDWYGVKFFYVKTDSSGQIILSSSDVPHDLDNLSKLAQETLVKNAAKGKINFHGQKYRYLKQPLNKKGDGYIFVYVDIHQEEDLLSDLLGVLIAVGIAGLVLAYIGSLFMASKALIPITKSWQRQKDFVADASHELRTPLSVIQTNLELIRGNPEETVASQAKWLENIQLETARMAKLVNDLLFLARADSNQQLLEKKRFPLHTAIINAAKPLEPAALKHGIELNISIKSETLFYGDETRIKQLIVILLDNAIKHTPPGGKVSLVMERHSGNIEISISDTGEGIEKQHLDRIFERFYRVDKVRNREDGSAGLGLSIAEWIVKSHNGTIKVASSLGVGTTFLIFLPAQ